jgi:AhpD family alkylhydroperoxidase
MTHPTIRVFDPAMCCSSGVCGPDVDPELLRFSADVDWLKGEGVAVERFNLAQQPAAFVAEPLVRQLLQEHGEGALPLVLVDGEVKSSGRHPTREMMAEWAGLGVDTGAWDARVAELAAIAASVAVSCVSCLSAHEQRARNLGISVADVRRAVDMGRAVREASVARIEQHAERLLQKQAAPLPAAGATSACCGPASGAGSSSCC